MMLFYLLLCLLCLGMWIMFAWPSATLKFFELNNNLINRPLSETENVLFACLPFFGGIISTAIAGIYLDKLGRKYCAAISSSFSLLSWIIIASTNRVEFILVAQFLAGLGAAIFAIAPIFISEICQSFIRGTLTSCCIVLYELGMLISFILGSCLECHVIIYMSLSMSAAGTICIYLLKESPVFLIGKDMDDEAAKSIAFYRETTPDSEEVIAEMNLIKRSFNYEIEAPDINREGQTLEPNEKVFGSLFETFKFIKRSRSTRQAVFVALILVSGVVFQGAIVVQVYIDTLLQNTIPGLSGPALFVLLTFVSIVVGLIAAYLIEVIGRRPLMIYSSFATGFSCILLGTQIYMEWGPKWITFVLLLLFTIVYNFGAGTVPFAVIYEIFLPEVYSIVLFLILEWTFLCCLIFISIFIPLISIDSTFAISSMFYISAVDCFLTVVFCFYYLPETKGLPVHEIQDLFNKKKVSS